MDWLDRSNEEVATLFAQWGEPGFRHGQALDWFHAKRVESFSAMKNLPAPLRARMEAEGPLRVLTENKRLVSQDELTTKWLYVAPGGAWVETVLIKEQRLLRRTVCVSCMAGCPLGCVFCATGKGGYERDLTTGEMLEQVYRADESCRAEGHGVSHVVFMGMGEPLLNLAAVIAAARRLTSQPGLGLSSRHITISTVGIPEGIRRLSEEKPMFRLAWSLHAPEQALRERLIPAAKRWPLPEVLDALRHYSTRASRDATIEYSLIDGVNSSPNHAAALARLLDGIPCKVNLIPLNPVDGFDGRPPPPAKVVQFRDLLEKNGVPATIRVEKGQDIGAACGQLRSAAAGK